MTDNVYKKMCSKTTDAKGKSLSVNRRLISGSVEDGLNQCLLKLLECPVCFEYMESPIHLCRNGHNICQKCRPRLSNCPVCRKSFLLTRNCALEALADQCLERCGNVNVGCNFKRTNVQDIEKHMEVCSYRLYKCEYGRPGGCSWMGRRWQILDHMHEDHESITILLENNHCKIKDFLLYDHDLTTQVIMAHGEVFWLRHRKDSSKFKFFGAVQ
ncbi:E3 ubiquitin-protein ligase SIAH1A-like [Cryptotermes secundus]|uniref:E3 ubiquitin-protein ligase SIAH1A-like n=1 Tax=Cryptotermes secundus TaxID=105785 RepID=UPI001454D60D|nr:E3 ubiquitin-protein ligase SIAH1A-like [Cryptotermes secundus]